MDPRPLSPHFQVYRLPLTAVLSFCHRVSGIFLSLGALVLVLVPISLAVSEDSFHSMQQMLASAGGRIFLWLWIVSFLYHLCHGCRHLLWDVGLGFGRANLIRNASLELVALLVLITLVSLLSSVSPTL